MDYFDVLVVKAGSIGWLLWALSIVTLAIIVHYFIGIRRSVLVPDPVRDQIEQYFENRQYREAIELTEQDPSFLSYVIHAGLSEASNGYAAMERSMEEAGEERTTKLLRHIEWLNVIGNVSPMLGLLGTVWGMINAFFAIVQAGGVNDVTSLADSIGIALVTTLLGLAIAIPSLAVYAVMRNRIDALSSEVMVISEELIGNFRPGRKGRQGKSEETPQQT